MHANSPYYYNISFIGIYMLKYILFCVSRSSQLSSSCPSVLLVNSVLRYITTPLYSIRAPFHAPYGVAIREHEKPRHVIQQCEMF